MSCTHMKSASEQYFDKIMRHDNRLIVSAADYFLISDYARATSVPPIIIIIIIKVIDLLIF